MEMQDLAQVKSALKIRFQWSYNASWRQSKTQDQRIAKVNKFCAEQVPKRQNLVSQK